MAMPLTYVEAPQVVPSPFGLLDTVPVIRGNERAGVGVEYEPAFCGPAHTTLAACIDPVDLGSISVSVDNAETATITGTGEPAGTDYTINWGDGNSDTSVALDGQTNTYAAAGVYTVTVTNTTGYYATVQVTVVENTAGGPFTADAVFHKIATDGRDLVEGAAIIAYHLFSCRTVGEWDAGEARALQSLDLGASRAVEEGFWPTLISGATDITPSGTAVDIVVGLALLEQRAGEVYGGRPVIHMDRAQATRLYARSALVRVGDHLETGLGSLVVAGAGYLTETGPSAPAAGASWMVATGTVSVWEGANKVAPPVLEVPYTNQFVALAERPYTAAFECFNVAVEVTGAA